MKDHVQPRRLISSLLLLATALTLALSLFFAYGSTTAKASVSPYSSHPIYANPLRLDDAGLPNAATGDFLCQQPTYSVHCYGPKQIRNAYAIDPLLDRGITGKGRTIVIVDAYQNPNLRSDLETFNETFKIQSSTLNIYAPDGLPAWDATDGNQVGWAEEITLDVEWTHAIAPDATIDLVEAKSNQDADILSATKFAVDHNLGDVISQSFGEAESCVDPKLLKDEHELFEAATRKHITLLASSGDQGAAQPTCDGTSYIKSVSSPASDPLVTAVGGTQLHADLKTGKYHDEIAWNETNFGAGTGGGYSTIYKRPAYQGGVVKNKGRGVPDVAYDAAIDYGVLVNVSVIPGGRQGGYWHIFGGTSASSPQWAGLIALADQLGGHRVGFINDTLYKIGRTPLYQVTLHDITQGDNSFTFADANGNPVTIEGYNATKGWDATTGWGSPIALTLVPALARWS